MLNQSINQYQWRRKTETGLTYEHILTPALLARLGGVDLKSRTVCYGG